MQRTSRRRLSSAALVLAGTAAVMAAGVGTAWAAADVSGTPSTNLHDGSQIAITGTGYGPNTALVIVQCSALTDTSCDTARLSSTTSDASGNVSTTFTVHTGAIGDGTCAPGSSNCMVAMTDLGGQYVDFFPISFAAASTPTPTPTPTKSTTPTPTATPTKSSTGGTGSTGGSTGGSGGAGGSGSTSGAEPPTSVAAGSGGAAGEQGPNVALALTISGAGTAAAAGMLLLRRRRQLAGL